MSLCYRIEETPTDLTGFFASFAAEPFAMLLDSAASGHPNSRFDILVAQPLSTLTARGQRCQLMTGLDTATPSHSEQDIDPFLLTKQLQQ